MQDLAHPNRGRRRGGLRHRPQAAPTAGAIGNLAIAPDDNARVQQVHDDRDRHHRRYYRRHGPGVYFYFGPPRRHWRHHRRHWD